MRVVTVLKSGGEYTPVHVYRLRAQIEKYLPGAKFLCFSDTKLLGTESVGLFESWPGWWSKMNIFHPLVRGDILYFDLDTSIVGDLKDIASVKRLTLMRDVYRPEGLQSSMMFLPERERALVWQNWMHLGPQKMMTRHSRGGDQAFLETFWLNQAKRWQDLLPGQIVSYKADKVKQHGIPEDARVVIFHGKPRPWDVGW